MSNSPSEIKSEFYPSYAEFSKTLRTWFVAYGIGGPVVLLANEKAWPTIVISGLSQSIGILFLIGGALQVVSALLNKHAMWHLYIGEEGLNDSPETKAKKSAQKRKPIYTLADWYSEQNWIDELLDLFSFVVFAWATWLTFKILSMSPGQFMYNATGSWYAWRIGLAIVLVTFLMRLYFSFKKVSAT